MLFNSDQQAQNHRTESGWGGKAQKVGRVTDSSAQKARDSRTKRVFHSIQHTCPSASLSDSLPHPRSSTLTETPTGLHAFLHTNMPSIHLRTSLPTWGPEGCIFTTPITQSHQPLTDINRTHLIWISLTQHVSKDLDKKCIHIHHITCR